MSALPTIMLAPNGARLTRADHSALPVTIDQIVDAAIEGYEAGADGLHAHVRDADQKHVLDAGLYNELLVELENTIPQMSVQITTEAVGAYSAQEQCDLVKDVLPENVSVAFRELERLDDKKELHRFYHWAQEACISVQHILYDISDIERWARFVKEAGLDEARLQTLLVLGRYAPNQISSPDDLLPMYKSLQNLQPNADWAVCAFGPNETACLKKAHDLGGKMRIGFENNTLNADGRIAANNAERISELVGLL